MQYIGNTDGDSLYVFATDAPQVFLGAGAQKAASLGDLLEKFSGVGEVVLPHDIPPLAAWSREAHYSPGDLVVHGGRYWKALDDVATGAQPDDVYAKDGSSGGWKPLLT